MMPGGDSLPVRIRNESEGRVKLRLSWNGWLPKAFTLQDAFTGLRRAVMTVWTGLGGVGVRFRDQKSRTTQSSEFGRRRSD